MRYAVEFPNAGPCADPRVAAELAVLAEESGWDGVFLEDYVTHHYARDVPTGDPWVTLAAMAVRTERVVLATAVTPLSRRRPWVVARQSTSIDQLSGGRFVLGAGLGDTNDPGFAACGEPVDPRTRAAMLDEALTILDGLWSGQPFAFQGAHYRLDEVTFLPTPDQRSRVPVWIGGGYPREAVVRRALRWDGSCMYHESRPSGEWVDMSPEDVRALRARVDAERGTGAAYDIVLGGRERGEDLDTERAHLAAIATAGATWWAEYVPVADPTVMRQKVTRGPLKA